MFNHETGYWNRMYSKNDQGVYISQIVKDKFDLSCSVDNDVKVATLAEMKFKGDQNQDDFIYLNIGTGIAAGFVSNKMIVRGINNDAGEIGHISIEGFNDVICYCGKKGCFEAISSGFGIKRRYLSGLKVYPQTKNKQRDKVDSVKQIVKMAEEGDEFCKKITDDAIEAILITVINLIKIFDPKSIILNGGIVSNSWFKNQIINRFEIQKKSINAKILFSELDPKTLGIIGAGILARDNNN